MKIASGSIELRNYSQELESLFGETEMRFGPVKDSNVFLDKDAHAIEPLI